jgi:serine/threonine protein kinase
MQAFDRRGVRLELIETSAAGGEGRIFQVAGDLSSVGKIFHDQRRTPELERKLQTMVARPPQDPTLGLRKHRSIAWPQRILYADSGQRSFVGYTMPAVDTEHFRQAHTYYDTSDRLRRFGGSYTWRHLLAAARNLASAVAAIHQTGHRIGDLRDANILVAPNALVTIIDTDSFQITDGNGRVYPTRVGTGEYLPAELQSIDFRSEVPDRYAADLFALAVLIFKLLMLGAHPCQARGDAVAKLPSTEAKIAAGVFPYQAFAGSDPPEFAPDFKILPPAIRSLAARAFVSGHRRPSSRPDATEWLAALDLAGPGLKTCRKNRYHMFGSHLRMCPWCRLAPKLKVDPFPRSGLLGDQAAVLDPEDAPPLEARLELLRSYAKVAVVDGAPSPAAAEFIHHRGAELGLRKSEVSGVIREEQKLAPKKRPAPTTPKPAPKPNRSLTELKKLVEQSSKWKRPEIFAEIAIGLVLSLAILVAPVIATAALVVALVPALATGGTVRRMKTSGAPTWKIALIGVARLPQNAVLSIYYLLPAAAVTALAVGLVSLSLRRWGFLPHTTLAALISASSILWLWWLLHRANDGQDFLAKIRGTLQGVVAWSLRPRRFQYRHVFLTVPLAALFTVLLANGLHVWWPLTQPLSRGG